MFMTIYNFTNHAVSFYRADDCNFTDPRRVVVRDGAVPYYTLSAGIPLNAQKGNKPLDPKFTAPVPLKGAVDFVSYDPLPSSVGDGDICIVSALYRGAVQALGGDTSQLAVIDTPVYDNTGKVVGCIGLSVG
jgi:hypothetical protein